MIPYYDRNGITIYCGDCLEIMPELEPGVDAIIADWPYGTTACAWDSIIDLDKLWPECKRLIKGNGAIVLMGSQPFTTLLINAEGLDWFKYEWIWNKTMSTGFVHVKNKPLKIHENILVFSPGTTVHKSQSDNRMVYNPQMRKGEPYKIFRKTDPRGDNWGGKGRSLYAGITHENNGERYPTSVITVSNPKNHTLHPTQKPVALMSYLIQTYTTPGELILDNTMGSGTTLVAAQQLGRRAIGIELSEEYCKIAVERLRQPSFFSIASSKPAIMPQQQEFDLD